MTHTVLQILTESCKNLSPREAVTVTAHARLHLGFIDLNGGLGRRFGSIGVAIEAPVTKILLRRAQQSTVTGYETKRIEKLLQRWRGLFAEIAPNAPAAPSACDQLGIDCQAAITAHAGLGSGTQIELALASGILAILGVETPMQLALSMIDRGARSGIGIGAFQQGGFILDGGRKTENSKQLQPSQPPILARYEFPTDWQWLLIFDNTDSGLHGLAETNAFSSLPAMPETVAAELSWITLMQLLPGIVEADFAAVSNAIGTIQTRVGDYFAKSQQGSRFTSTRVASLISKLSDSYRGFGQSSWGPTGFILLPSKAEAESVQSFLNGIMGNDSNFLAISTTITTARNLGATVAA